jgi:hypothetical protein
MAAGLNPLYHFLTYANFSEAAYEVTNPDVAASIKAGIIKSGLVLFAINGPAEGRSGAGSAMTGKLSHSNLCESCLLLRLDELYSRLHKAY